jgi:hypothetical protein
MVKSPAVFTISVTLTECTTAALVPRMEREYVPAGVDALVDTVSDDEPDPVTVAGLNAAVAPAGRPEAESVTLPVKPAPAVTAAV